MTWTPNGRPDSVPLWLLSSAEISELLVTMPAEQLSDFAMNFRESIPWESRSEASMRIYPMLVAALCGELAMQRAKLEVQNPDCTPCVVASEAACDCSELSPSDHQFITDTVAMHKSRKQEQEPIELNPVNTKILFGGGFIRFPR